TNTLSLFDELALAVTVTDQLTEPFQALLNGGAPNVCMTGSAVLQASGGSAYLWSTGSTNASITVNTAGIYTVTVTNDVSCTASASITVGQNPSITASAGNVPVCAGSNIQLGSTPSGGGGVYTTFSWEGPDGFSSALEDPMPLPATPAAAGAYTVTVTSGAGCTASASVSVAVSGNSAPVVMVTANSPLCAGSDLSLHSIPSGGSGVYSTFRWSGPNNFVSAFQNPLAFAASTASTGVYTVTVTDNAGCTATGTIPVLVKAMPLISATNNGPVCTGKNIQLDASGSGGAGAPYTYSWLGVNGFNSAQEDPAAFAAASGSGGAYTVTVTDGGGCTATASTTVKVNSLPAIMTSLSGPVCAAGSIGLQSTPSGGTAPYVQFAWEGPNYAAGVEDPQPFPAMPGAAGAYTVTVTDHAGCTATGSISVVIHPVPTITATSNSPVCEGFSLKLTSNPTGGSTPYSGVNWNGPDFYVASLPNPATFTTTPASAGVYQVKVTDKEGCTATATATVVVNPSPSVSAANNGPVCLGSNIDLKAMPSGGSGVYSAFNWTGPAGYMGTGQIPTGVIATGTRAGIYYVTVSDNAGCSATASTNVFISPFTAPSISASVVSPVCAGGSITLGSMPSGGLLPYTAFKWSGPDNYSSPQQSPPVFTASTAAAGVYTVTVTDSRGCAGTSSVSVQVSAPKVSPAASSPICLGSTVYLSANPSGSLGTYVSFSWSGPGGYMATGENPAGFPASAGSAGPYTVTVTDFLNCTGSGTVSVSLEANDPPTITCPADQTLATDDGCTAILGSWISFATNLSDDCTASGDIAVTQMPAASSPLSGHDDEKTVTLTADDGTGNKTPCTFKVILKDNKPPSITCPPDQTLEADDGCAGQTGDWVSLATNISDNCTVGGSIGVTQSPAANTALSGHGDEVEVTLTADDGHGNTTPCTFKVRLKDVTPPSIACPPDQTVAADANCSGVAGDRRGMAEALDNCTPGANILLTQTPAAGTPLSGHNAELTIKLTADDLHGNTADCSFKVTLKDVTPPAITCPNNATVSCAANLPGPNAGSVFASDNCSTPVKSYLYDTAPYDSVCVNRFKVDRYYRAIDAVGNSSTCLQVITVQDETPPNLLFVPANVTVQCNAIPKAGSPSGVDNCAGNVDIAYNGQTVSNILCTDSYTLTRQWTATDVCGNTKTATQRITVRDTQKPLFTSVPVNVTVECNAVPNVGTATATDNCDTDVTVIFEGESRTNGSCPDTYTLTRRWKAVDNCGNTRTATQRVTVRDTQKPVFTGVPQNVTLECTDPLPDVGTATATDNCDASVTVTYLGAVCIFSSCLQTHEWVRTWRATDNCGNSTTAVQVITVRDFRAPVFTSVPQNVTLQCTDFVPFVGNPTATDNCSGIVQITFLGQSNTGGDCPQEYVLT
ncbi:MAG: hypothetical protein L6Q97_18935, partial [Thermoanaerobaculia bacterium]|nr:hypothetical protein [Thermoanaerobaculia bacterium]